MGGLLLRETRRALICLRRRAGDQKVSVLNTFVFHPCLLYNFTSLRGTQQQSVSPVPAVNDVCACAVRAQKLEGRRACAAHFPSCAQRNIWRGTSLGVCCASLPRQSLAIPHASNNITNIFCLCCGSSCLVVAFVSVRRPPATTYTAAAATNQVCYSSSTSHRLLGAEVQAIGCRPSTSTSARLGLVLWHGVVWVRCASGSCQSAYIYEYCCTVRGLRRLLFATPCHACLRRLRRVFSPADLNVAVAYVQMVKSVRVSRTGYSSISSKYVELRIV